MRIIFLISCLLLVVSCKKERTIHITAKNAVTGQPYAGLTYYVVQKKTGYDEEEFKTMATGTLNADGEAFLTMKLKKAHAYGVRVEEPSNTCYFNELAFHFGNQESNFDAHFKYAECANLKFRYHNIDCQGPDDYIKVNRYTNLEGYVGFIIDAEYDGCADYTMPDFVAVPMGWWYFEWEVTKNNITEYYSDSIYLTSGEFKEYTFEY